MVYSGRYIEHGMNHREKNFMAWFSSRRYFFSSNELITSHKATKLLLVRDYISLWRTSSKRFFVFLDFHSNGLLWVSFSFTHDWTVLRIENRRSFRTIKNWLKIFHNLNSHSKIIIMMYNIMILIIMLYDTIVDR